MVLNVVGTRAGAAWRGFEPVLCRTRVFGEHVVLGNTVVILNVLYPLNIKDFEGCT